MKYAEFVKAGEMKLVNKPIPKIETADDVIIKVLRTRVCGSDLGAYRGLEEQVMKMMVTKLSELLKKLEKILLL